MEKLITIEFCLKDLKDAMSFAMLYKWMMDYDEIYAFKEDDDNRWRLEVLINEHYDSVIHKVLKGFDNIIIKIIS